MQARYGGVLELKIRLWPSTDYNRDIMNVDAVSQAWAVDDHQAGIIQRRYKPRPWTSLPGDSLRLGSVHV